jgi:DNA-binding MarR family transcriptional regulator
MRALNKITKGDASSAGRRFVDDYLLYLLAAASHGASREFHAVVRKAGLRVPDWRVLACVSDADGLMVTELARLTLFEQSRVTKIIDQLEAKGLVTRRDDVADKRRVRIFITGAGRTRVGPLIEAARAHEAQLFGRLPSRTRMLVKEALRSLIDEDSARR